MEYARSRKFGAVVFNLDGIRTRLWQGVIKDTIPLMKFADRAWLRMEKSSRRKDLLVGAVKSYEGDIMYIDPTKSLYDHAFTPARDHLSFLDFIQLHIYFGDKQSIERVVDANSNCDR